MDTPNLPKQRPINPSQSPPPPAWWQDRLKLSLVIAVAVFAVIVTVLLLMFVNGPDGEGAVASATPSPSSSAPSSPSASAEPTSSTDPSSSVAPSPTSSASAAPSDPPQAELAEGWARINTGLNLRDGAGDNNPIVTKLQPGEVVWVSSGPYRENEADDQVRLVLRPDSARQVRLGRERDAGRPACQRTSPTSSRSGRAAPSRSSPARRSSTDFAPDAWKVSSVPRSSLPRPQERLRASGSPTRTMSRPQGWSST